MPSDHSLLRVACERGVAEPDTSSPTESTSVRGFRAALLPLPESPQDDKDECKGGEQCEQQGVVWEVQDLEEDNCWQHRRFEETTHDSRDLPARPRAAIRDDKEQEGPAKQSNQETLNPEGSITPLRPNDPDPSYGQDSGKRHDEEAMRPGFC